MQKGTIDGVFIDYGGAGIANGEIRTDVDPDAAATWVICCIEGGVMLSNLYKDSEFLNRALDQLLSYTDTALAAKP